MQTCAQTKSKKKSQKARVTNRSKLKTRHKLVPYIYYTTINTREIPGGLYLLKQIAVSMQRQLIQHSLQHKEVVEMKNAVNLSCRYKQ